MLNNGLEVAGNDVRHQTENRINLEENFGILYPLFKEEVFRRRTHMMGLSAAACTLLVSILVLFPLMAPTPLAESSYRWMSITGVIALFNTILLSYSSTSRTA